ncbi:hypothetical protein MBANPS3_004555 [Mucor bainieri]
MTIACPNNEQTTLANDIKQPINSATAIAWPILNQISHSYNEETEDEASSLDDSDSMEHVYLNCSQDHDGDPISSDMEESAICGCGKVLSAGWDCSQCRRPNETCNRCVSVKRDTIVAN